MELRQTIKVQENIINNLNNEVDNLDKDNDKLKQYLLNIGMIIEELELQYNDIKNFTEIKEIKEILNEVQQ